MPHAAAAAAAAAAASASVSALPALLAAPRRVRAPAAHRLHLGLLLRRYHCHFRYERLLRTRTCCRGSWSWRPLVFCFFLGMLPTMRCWPRCCRLVCFGAKRRWHSLAWLVVLRLGDQHRPTQRYCSWWCPWCDRRCRRALHCYSWPTTVTCLL